MKLLMQLFRSVLKYRAAYVYACLGQFHLFKFSKPWFNPKGILGHFSSGTKRKNKSWKEDPAQYHISSHGLLVVVGSGKSCVSYLLYRNMNYFADSPVLIRKLKCAVRSYYKISSGVETFYVHVVHVDEEGVRHSIYFCESFSLGFLHRSKAWERHFHQKYMDEQESSLLHIS